MWNKSSDTKLIELPFDINCRQYICPACGNTITVDKTVFYGRCNGCSLTVIDYVPAPHQKSFHQSNAKYKLNIGGYGSGKTTEASAEIIINHALEVPNGKTLITAPTIKQIKDVMVPSILKFLPPWLIDGNIVNNPSFSCKLINGHEIVSYASNDEENLKSIEVTAFYIEEGSAIDLSIFTQLQARLRHPAAVSRLSDGTEVQKFVGIVNTNPEYAWYVDHFLLLSNIIHASPQVDIAEYKELKSLTAEPAYETFLSSTRDNRYLSKGYISELCAGKSSEWIAKYIDCKLTARQGLIYPMFSQSFVKPFPIPLNWKRVAGFDKGWSDETAMLIGAIDPISGTIYIYEEYYVNRQPMSFHAAEISKIVKPYRWYTNIQADPSVRNKNERDGVSYAQYFYKLCQIVLEEADNNIDIGIDRVRDLMYLGKIKFFSNLENLIKEFLNYRYKEKGLVGKEKPVDKNNHLLDCLRYLTTKLPLDNQDLLGYNRDNVFVPNQKKEENQTVFGYSEEDLIPETDNNIIVGGGYYGY